MCEPATIASLAGIAGQGIGGLMGASSQRVEGLYQARSLETQATLMDAAASDALVQGRQDEGRARMAGTQVVGAQRVAAGASGVAVDSGSVLRLMEDSRVMSELDALQSANNAAREAWGYQTQAQQTRAEAVLARKGAGAKAGATLLTTAGTVGSGLADFTLRRKG